jgi:hypothetical protein
MGAELTDPSEDIAPAALNAFDPLAEEEALELPGPAMQEVEILEAAEPEVP